MRIAIFIANAYGMGGTIRTVFNLAEGLAVRHEVEIVSFAQHREEPFFPAPAGVTLHPLAPFGEDAEEEPPRGLIGRWRERRATELVPDSEARRNQIFDARRIRRLRDYLRASRADVVMGTRPGINLLLSRYAPARMLRIGQEHVNLDAHAADLREAIRRNYPRLDGMSVLTQSDLRAYTSFLESADGWVRPMPNALPAGTYPRSAQDNPIIAAAGRMSPVKQYPKLLDAFAVVARRHPEWRLRIYGGGKKDEKLRDRIAAKGLSNQVALMGRTKDLAGELAKASILAVSSRHEGFGMTIIEGFSVGVPAVSFDCPYGPREIIDHERNGLLVPHQDVAALADGLLRLVEDRDERVRMAQEALTSAADYDVAAITRRWEDFLAERLAAKRGTRAA
ncbi:glycosyltransferase family 4 protein [Nocardiopsis trehalosi]|uniref:glycosyltransferase family 4 protein n=1 Tax=Nocardiopsis trehalosi TaxID=109329 RepID=UPI000837A73C|nr:glycosyltransferase family 4 protein [Nocardiopsis trehalosi]